MISIIRGGAWINRWRLVLIVVIASLHLFMAMACALREDDLSAYNEGVEHLDAGNSILAEQQFKLALQKNPDLAEAHLNLGLLYLEQGWLEGSQESTMKAIRILESTRKTVVKGSTYEQPLSLAYNNLGAIEAQRVVDAELKRNPVEARAHWEKAMHHFRKAVELDPNNAIAHGNMRRFTDAY